MTQLLCHLGRLGPTLGPLEDSETGLVLIPLWLPRSGRNFFSTFFLPTAQSSNIHHHYFQQERQNTE